jgi:SAM-dependent MidA family methyltransferase
VACLSDRILGEIDREGPMTCARFMELALYDEEAGYYMADERRAGREWVTAPTLSPVFGRTLARLLGPPLAGAEAPSLVEVGTGGGELVRDLALGLHEDEPDVFADLELVPVDRSPAARERATSELEQAGIALDDVHVADELPEDIEGAIVANELLDALPTHVCQHTEQGLAEIHLERGEPTLSPTLAAPSEEAITELASRFQGQLSPGLRFEAPLQAYGWYREAARRLRRGVIVIVDYGARRRKLLTDYPKGTIHAYRQGRRVEEFWYDPGRMDITYRVPLDEIARVGQQEGLDTLAFATQAEVLDRLGVRELAREAGSSAQLAAKKLLDPGGAGGTFRVLVQGRGIDRDALPMA